MLLFVFFVPFVDCIFSEAGRDMLSRPLRFRCRSLAQNVSDGVSNPEALSQLSQCRSPDEAACGAIRENITKNPDFAALHPGYAVYSCVTSVLVKHGLPFGLNNRLPSSQFLLVGLGRMGRAGGREAMEAQGIGFE